MPLHYQCSCGTVYREDSAHGSNCPNSKYPADPIATGNRTKTITHKKPLIWYEDHAAEIIYNEDGSVTFIFDDLGPNDPLTGAPPTSRTTICKEDYEAATKDSGKLI